MKTEFKAKFLQHINLKQREEGFTLIELLVVVIIIGILAAVALPSLLSQANKAKQVEARNNIGAMNRAQQAVYLEEQQFASTMPNLGVGIPTQTVNYKYDFVVANIATGVVNTASTLKANLKPYSGKVWTQPIDNQSTTQAILCEEIAPSTGDGLTAPSETGIVANAANDCGGMKALGE